MFNIFRGALFLDVDNSFAEWYEVLYIAIVVV